MIQVSIVIQVIIESIWNPVVIIIRIFPVLQAIAIHIGIVIYIPVIVRIRVRIRVRIGVGIGITAFTGS